MVTLTPRDKQRYLRSILAYSSIIALCALLFYLLVFPKYAEINVSIAQADASYNSYENVLKNGFAASEIPGVLQQYGLDWKIDPRLLQDPERLGKLTTQAGWKEYLLWLEWELKNTNFDKAASENILKLVSGSLPILGDNLGGVVDQIDLSGQITLESLVRFIEEKILQKYGFISLVPIGFESASVYPDASDARIVTLDFPLEVVWQPSDIMRFLRDNQRSGLLPYTASGTLDYINIDESKAAGTITNPLIQISRFTFAESPNLPREDPTAPFSASMNLKIFVRAPDARALTPVKNALMKSATEKRTEIDEAINACLADTNCGGVNKYQIDRLRLIRVSLEDAIRNLEAITLDGIQLTTTSALFTSGRTLERLRSGADLIIAQIQLSK